jgi:hypothetical protein
MKPAVEFTAKIISAGRHPPSRYPNSSGIRGAPCSRNREPPRPVRARMYRSSAWQATQMITGNVALGVAWTDRLNLPLDSAGYSDHSCPKFRNRTLSRYLAYQPLHLTQVPTPTGLPSEGRGDVVRSVCPHLYGTRCCGN